MVSALVCRPTGRRSRFYSTLWSMEFHCILCGAAGATRQGPAALGLVRFCDKCFHNLDVRVITDYGDEVGLFYRLLRNWRPDLYKRTLSAQTLIREWVLQRNDRSRLWGGLPVDTELFHDPSSGIRIVAYRFSGVHVGIDFQTQATLLTQNLMVFYPPRRDSMESVTYQYDMGVYRRRTPFYRRVPSPWRSSSPLALALSAVLYRRYLKRHRWHSIVIARLLSTDLARLVSTFLSKPKRIPELLDGPSGLGPASRKNLATSR